MKSPPTTPLSATTPSRVGVRGPGVPLTLLALPLLLFLAVPVAILLARTTPRAIAGALRERETIGALALSLGTTTVSLAVCAALGTPLALWLARGQSRLGAIVETIVDLPTVLPPSVAGLALLLTFGRTGPVGAWLHATGIGLAFTPVAVVLAQVFVSAPYFVRSARAGFASVDREMLDAALAHGATPAAALRRVVLPLAAPSLGAGAAMCWGRAVGEFGATLLFAGSFPGRTRTMPLAVYLGLESGLDRALVLSAILVALALLVLVMVRLWGRRPVP